MASKERANAIFRREVAERRANEWLGEVRVARPLPVRFPLVVLLSVGGLLCALVFAGVANSNGRTVVSGELRPEGGVLTVTADMAGTVASVLVAEGQKVRPGQPLAVLRADREFTLGNSIQIIRGELEMRLADAQSSLTRLDEREDRLRSRTEAELRSIELELSVLGAEAELLSQRLRRANEATRAAEMLWSDGLLALEDVYSKQQDARTVEASELARRRIEVALRRQADLAEASLVERLAELEDQRSQLKREVSLLVQQQTEFVASYERVVVSPVEGEIGPLVEFGQAVTPGDPLLMMTASDGRLEAVLEVPGRAISGLEIGAPLLLRLEAYPHQQFGLQQATVTSIGQLPMPDVKGVYRVRARLQEQSVKKGERTFELLPGMRFEADIKADPTSPPRRMIERLSGLVKGLRPE